MRYVTRRQTIDHPRWYWDERDHVFRCEGDCPFMETRLWNENDEDFWCTYMNEWISWWDGHISVCHDIGKMIIVFDGTNGKNDLSDFGCPHRKMKETGRL